MEQLTKQSPTIFIFTKGSFYADFFQHFNVHSLKKKFSLSTPLIYGEDDAKVHCKKIAHKDEEECAKSRTVGDKGNLRHLYIY